MGSVSDLFRGLEMVSQAVKTCEGKMRGEIESVRCDIEAHDMKRCKGIMEATESVTQKLSKDLIEERDMRTLAFERLSKRIDGLGEQLESVAARADAAASRGLFQSGGLPPELAEGIAEMAREEVAKAFPKLRIEARAEARQEAGWRASQAQADSSALARYHDKGGAAFKPPTDFAGISVDVTGSTTYSYDPSDRSSVSHAGQKADAQADQLRDRLRMLEEQNAQLQAETARIQADASSRADKTDFELQEAATRSEVQRLTSLVRDVAQALTPLNQKVESSSREAQRNARENRNLGCRVDVMEAQMKTMDREHKPVVTGMVALRAEVSALTDRSRGQREALAATPASVQAAGSSERQAAASPGQQPRVLQPDAVALTSMPTRPCVHSNDTWPLVERATDFRATASSPVAGPYRQMDLDRLSVSDRLVVTTPCANVSHTLLPTDYSARRIPSKSPAAGERGTPKLIGQLGGTASPTAATSRSSSRARQRSQSRGAVSREQSTGMKDSVERLVGKIDRVLSQQAMGMSANELAAMADTAAALTASRRGTHDSVMRSPPPGTGRSSRQEVPPQNHFVNSASASFSESHASMDLSSAKSMLNLSSRRVLGTSEASFTTSTAYRHPVASPLQSGFSVNMS